MKNSFLSTNPSSASLWIENTGLEIIDEIEGLPEIEQAEFRNQIMARIKTGPDEWKTIWLFLFDDFTNIKINKFLSEEGEWPPVAISLPLGRLLAGMYDDYMAKILNFAIYNREIPFSAFLSQAAFGFFIPFIAAAYPVWKGSRITVRQALDDHGISNNQFGNSVFDIIISKFGGFTRPLLLSIRNTFRKKSRLVLMLLTLTIGGAVLLSAFNIQTTVRNGMDVIYKTLKYDINLSLNDYYESEFVQGYIYRIWKICTING